MPENEVEISEDLVQELQLAMSNVDAIYERQRRAFMAERGLVEMLVGRVEGRLQVHLQFSEHPPPHFSVRHPEGIARFRIDNGERLKPDRDLAKYDRAIKAWQKRNHRYLALEWNRCRPDGCTVGEIAVPEEVDKQ